MDPHYATYPTGVIHPGPVVVPVKSQVILKFLAVAPADQPVQLLLHDLQGTTLTKHDLQSVGGIQRAELPMIGRTAGLYLVEVVTPLQRKTVMVLKQ